MKKFMMLHFGFEKPVAPQLNDKTLDGT